MLSHYLFTALGGALGATARVGLSHLLPISLLGIPFAILCVNVLGCFAMGVLSELLGLYFSVPDNFRYFLISGLLGGFTTFSAFALEFGSLIEKNAYVHATAYAMISVGLSLACFFLGIKIVKWL